MLTQREEMGTGGARLHREPDTPEPPRATRQVDLQARGTDKARGLDPAPSTTSCSSCPPLISVPFPSSGSKVLVLLCCYQDVRSQLCHLAFRASHSSSVWQTPPNSQKSTQIGMLGSSNHPGTEPQPRAWDQSLYSAASFLTFFLFIINFLYQSLNLCLSASLLPFLHQSVHMRSCRTLT